MCPFFSGELKRHIDVTHLGNNKHKCEVPNCDKVYDTRTGLKRHMETHTGEYRYRCDICGAGFSYSAKYQEHIDRHHELKAHICVNCGRGFIRKSDLDFHMSICGAKSRQVACPVCNKLFKHAKYMRAHQNVHTAPDRYMCVRCGKSYPHKGSLKKHEESHLEKNVGDIKQGSTLSI